MTGCAGVQDRQAREALFTGNLAAFKPQAPDEEAALRELARYKRAHETFDLAAMQRLLHPAFELRYHWKADEVTTQDLESFLKPRREWTARAEPARDMVVAVQGVHHDQARGRVAITALTTYRSRHFRPRFLEVFVFERAAEEWRLRRLLSYPMLPPRPEAYEVEIYLGRYLTNRQYLTGWDPEMMAEGADAVFERIVSLGEVHPSQPPGVETPIVLVFPEPPPEGAVVTTQVSYPDGASYTRAFGVHRRGNPFYFLNPLNIGGANVAIWVKVQINGVTVAQRKLALQ